MQHSPAEPAPMPELPTHHRAGPLHWIATASAMAAVIAAAGLLQPDPATGAPAAPSTAGNPGARSAPQEPAPDAHALTYPLACGTVAQLVTATAQGDLDGDGRPETVAAVRCDAGSGTPPHAIYVLTRAAAPGSAPRVVATLLDPARRQNATDLTVSDGRVTATLLGYSSRQVPRSDPDVKQLSKWRWVGGKFRQELTDSTARSV